MKANLKHIIIIFLIFYLNETRSQGLNNNFLLGNQSGIDSFTITPHAIINFAGGANIISSPNQKMTFYDTQANISDLNGNLQFASNGVWIANSTGDTMMNGSGLNPGSFTDDYHDGLVLPNGMLIFPYPGDSTKFVLFHMTGNYSLSLPSSELYYSIVDITLDGGLGAVTLKNSIVLQDTLSWGISACKHANGRDWWIIALKDSSDIIYKILFTSNGVESITTQSLGTPSHGYQANQPTFSPDGSKLAYVNSYNYGQGWVFEVRLFDFDRCNGIFSNLNLIDCSDGHPGFGVAFSASSKFLYVASTYHIFQINTDTTAIAASLDSVATNDGFYSPTTPFLANFWLMYLGADNKIYITSGNSVVDLHYINHPDSDGIACDVRLHALHLPCYHSRSVPNHPNYFLGAEHNTICDSITSDVLSISSSLRSFNLFPNPARNILYITQVNKEQIKSISGFNSIGQEQQSISYTSIKNNEYIEVNTSSLSSGIYFLHILTDKQNITKRFVKE